MWARCAAHLELGHGGAEALRYLGEGPAPGARGPRRGLEAQARQAAANHSECTAARLVLRDRRHAQVRSSPGETRVLPRSPLLALEIRGRLKLNERS